MGNLTFLFAGFTVIWLVMLLYSYSIAARQKSLERDLQMLKAVLDEREAHTT